jgi:hypothetical protein
LGFQAAALGFDHVLSQPGSGAEQEYRNAMEREPDLPAGERPEVPGVGGRELPMNVSR